MGLDFLDRVAIITGAGGGLGRQHALALAARGAKVVNNAGILRDKSFAIEGAKHGFATTHMTRSSDPHPGHRV